MEFLGSGGIWTLLLVVVVIGALLFYAAMKVK